MNLRAVAAIVVVAIAMWLHVYGVRSDVGGFVLWNDSEADFFIKANAWGYRATYLSYPWILFKEYVIGGFAGAAIPDESREYLRVIRVTSSGVEDHSMELGDRPNGDPRGDPSRFTPINGRIYAYCPWVIGRFLQNGQEVGKGPEDALCWWAGDHFEKATEQEQRELQGVDRLTRDDFQANEDGWSRQAFIVVPIVDRKFTVSAGDTFQINVANTADGPRDYTISIDLQRPGKAQERLAVLRGRSGIVSKAEYDRILDRR